MTDKTETFAAQIVDQMSTDDRDSFIADPEGWHEGLSMQSDEGVEWHELRDAILSRLQ